MASAPVVAARPAWSVRLPALWALLRPFNCAMTALAVAVGAYVQAGPALAAQGPSVALAAVAGFAFAGAGNALNDYVDRDVDRVAHPERPVSSGRALARDALRVQTLLFTLAAVAAALVSAAAFLAVLLLMGLMVAYEVRLKARGLPGNLAIAALTGAPFVFGALAVGEVGAPALVLAVLAVLATLGREIIKDVEDVAGDVGRRTLPMRIGAPRALRAAQLSLLAAVVLSPLPLLTAPALGWGYVGVAAADAVLVGSAVQAKQAHRAQVLAKAGMLLALVAFALGRFTA